MCETKNLPSQSEKKTKENIALTTMDIASHALDLHYSDHSLSCPLSLSELHCLEPSALLSGARGRDLILLTILIIDFIRPNIGDKTQLILTEERRRSSCPSRCTRRRTTSSGSPR